MRMIFAVLNNRNYSNISPEFEIGILLIQEIRCIIDINTLIVKLLCCGQYDGIAGYSSKLLLFHS